MRVTDDQIVVILRIVRRQVGDDARVWVYGSRLDDSRKGGDLDLVVETPEHLTTWQLADLKLGLERELQIPVDILAYQHGTQPSPFQAIAMAHGVRVDQVA